MKEDVKKPSKDGALLPGTGSIVEGKVVARDRSAIYIDLGPQGTGIIFGREFYQAKEAIKALSIGDVVHAKVVEMENEEVAKEAMNKLDGTELNGRSIAVKEAKPQIPR